jgi:glucose-1-phosphate adenylyltransferase
VAVFGADDVYRMDPAQLIEAHLAWGAGVTVAAIPVGVDKDRARERGFAVSEGGVTVVGKGRVVEP